MLYSREDVRAVMQQAASQNDDHHEGQRAAGSAHSSSRMPSAGYAGVLSSFVVQLDNVCLQAARLLCTLP